MALKGVGEAELRHGRFADPVGVAIFAAVAVAVYLRLFYAVDFTDDAFYVALPYSFVLGHRPLADELAAHQFAALLLLPMFKVYVGLLGSDAGVVLFARHLYFAASFATALVARHTLTAAFGSRAGNLAGALTLAYIPFLLPTLGYNSIACLGMLAGTMLLASACMPGRGSAWLAAGTTCVAIASFAYPPVIVAATAALVLALAVFWAVREPEARSKALLAVTGAGFMSTVAALAATFHYGTLADLKRLSDINEALAYQGGGREKLAQILQEVVHQAPYGVALAATMVGILCCIRLCRSPWLAAAVAALTGPALFALEYFYRPWREPFTTAPFVLIALGLLAPIALRIVREKMSRHAYAGLMMISVSSLLCAAIVLWATANGLRNGALGLLPASAVALGCVAVLRPSEDPRGHALVFTAFAVSLLVFQVSQIWTHVYRDSPISMLDARIDSGAWMGVRTTTYKKRFVETFMEDLATHREGAETVLFMDYFPGGYLLSDLRPRTPAIYLLPWNDTQQGTRAGREIYARGFADEGSFPDMLVRIKCLPAQAIVPIPQRADDPVVLRLVTGGYEQVATRDCYNIWRRGTGARP